MTVNSRRETVGKLLYVIEEGVEIRRRD